jgi:hypothetical protein
MIAHENALDTRLLLLREASIVAIWPEYSRG